MTKKSEEFTVRMEFDDDAIRLMFKTEYFTYEKLRLLLRYVIAAGLIFAAALSTLLMPVKTIMLLVGAWLFVTPDFPSKVLAEGVIEKRGGQKSTVEYRFTGKGIHIGSQAGIPYGEIDRLVEDDRYFYIFRDRQNAVMTPKEALSDAQAFRAFIQEKTGKEFKRNTSLLTMNLRQMIQMVKDQQKSRRK